VCLVVQTLIVATSLTVVKSVFNRFFSTKYCCDPLWPIVLCRTIWSVKRRASRPVDFNCICWVRLFDSDRFVGRECAVAQVSSFDSEPSTHLLIGRVCALARVSSFDSEYWWARVRGSSLSCFLLSLNRVKTLFAHCVTCCNIWFPSSCQYQSVRHGELKKQAILIQHSNF